MGSEKNKIEFTCINEKGAESFRAMTLVEYHKHWQGDLYYIGFGVSKYKNSDLNLQYAHKDANDLQKLFLMMKGKQFQTLYSKLFVNEEVTVKNIRVHVNYRILLAKNKAISQNILKKNILSVRFGKNLTKMDKPDLCQYTKRCP